MGLLKKLYESVGPKVRVDSFRREFEILDEGLFFEHLTRTYYVLKGYKQIERED